MQTTYERPTMIVARALSPQPKFKLSAFDINGQFRIFKKKKQAEMRAIKILIYRYCGFVKGQYVDVSRVESDSRKRELCLTRQLATFFIHRYKKDAWTLEKIGEEVGGRDHSTVKNSLKTVQNLIDTDKRFAAKVDKIDSYLHKHLNNL